MRSTHFSVVAAFGAAWILVGCAAMESRAAAAPASARITVLYDAFGKNAAMARDWGYAALVEISGKRILFDTGDALDDVLRLSVRNFMAFAISVISPHVHAKIFLFPSPARTTV